MKDNRLRKGLVYAIVVLFFELCITPSIIGMGKIAPSFSSDAVVDALPIVIIIEGTCG